MAKYPKIKPVNLAMQQFIIKNLYPQWNCKIVGNQMTCIGKIKPSELSRTYTIGIYYTLKKNPKVMVIKPKLEKNSEGNKPPHLYPGDFLCLYHPWFNEWDKSKIIAQTIIPWISLWLYYYEIWLATGEWKGGGIHPAKKDVDENE